MLRKIRVNAKYIDNVLVYLNQLLDLPTGENITSCGMCDATPDIPMNCFACPLDSTLTGVSCSNRNDQLKTKTGTRTYYYSSATKKSIQDRVQWIADQVNEHTVSKWTIYLKAVK